MKCRFAILQHTLPASHERAGTHWDLLFELPDPDSRLLTFACPQPPTDATDMVVERLPDHRRLYLDYEGPISDDRGEVVRWDRGEYQGGWMISGQLWRAELQGARPCVTVEFRLRLDGRWQAVANDAAPE